MSKVVVSVIIHRTVARKFSIRGLCSSAGGLEIIKLTETPLIHSVSRFKLGGLELCLGGLNPPKPPVATGQVIQCITISFGVRW